MADNVGLDYTIKGNDLVITVDLTGDFGMSKSGKTVKVASSGGFEYFKNPSDPDKKYMFSLNVNKKP